VVETDDLTHIGVYEYEVKALMAIDPNILPLFTTYGKPLEKFFPFILTVQMCEVASIAVTAATPN